MRTLRRLFSVQPPLQSYPGREVLSHRRRALIFVLMIAALILAAASETLHDTLYSGIAAAGGFIQENPISGAVLFIILAAFSAMVVFFSTALMIPIAIYTWGRSATLLLLWIGWLLGGVLSYAVGRYPGRRMLRWLVPRNRVERYEEIISAAASFPRVLLFQLAFPSEVPGYVLGSVGYRFKVYLAALALAELPFALGAVYLGESFLHRDYPWLIALAAGGALLSLGSLYALRRKVRSRVDGASVFVTRVVPLTSDQDVAPGQQQ